MKCFLRIVWPSTIYSNSRIPPFPAHRAGAVPRGGAGVSVAAVPGRGVPPVGRGRPHPRRGPPHPPAPGPRRRLRPQTPATPPHATWGSPYHRHIRPSCAPRLAGARACLRGWPGLYNGPTLFHPLTRSDVAACATSTRPHLSSNLLLHPPPSRPHPMGCWLGPVSEQQLIRRDYMWTRTIQSRPHYPAWPVLLAIPSPQASIRMLAREGTSCGLAKARHSQGPR